MRMGKTRLYPTWCTNQSCAARPFHAAHPQLQLSNAFLSASRVVHLALPVFCLLHISRRTASSSFSFPSLLSSHHLSLFPHLTCCIHLSIFQSFFHCWTKPSLYIQLLLGLHDTGLVARQVRVLPIHQRARSPHSSPVTDTRPPCHCQSHRFKKSQHSADLASGQLRSMPPATPCCSTSFSRPAAQCSRHQHWSFHHRYAVN